MQDHKAIVQAAVYSRILNLRRGLWVVKARLDKRHLVAEALCIEDTIHFLQELLIASGRAPGTFGEEEHVRLIRTIKGEAMRRLAQALATREIERIEMYSRCYYGGHPNKNCEGYPKKCWHCPMAPSQARLAQENGPSEVANPERPCGED